MKKLAYASLDTIAAALFLTVSIASAVSLPGSEALFETSLQDRIMSTDTSITLVTNSLRGSQTITGYHCFVLDKGHSDSEHVCGTISGTSVAGLERGLGLLTTTTTISHCK